jgi:hypothetical protein
MATIDPALLARAKAQIESHPLFARFKQGRGRAQMGSLDPKLFGVDYLPDGYVYSLGNGAIEKNWGPADTIMTAVGGGLLGAGVLGAAGVGPLAGGGGSGAASSAVPVTGAGAGEIAATSAPLGSVPVTPGVVAAGAAPTGVSQAVGTAMPRAGREVMDAASDGGKGFLKDLASPDNIAGLGALIAGLVGSRNTNPQQSEELQRINAITETQMRRADPLHQVAVNLAFGRMPVNYRNGVQLTNEPLPPR